MDGLSFFSPDRPLFQRPDRFVSLLSVRSSLNSGFRQLPCIPEAGPVKGLNRTRRVDQQVVIILRPTDRAPQIFTALHMGRSASFRASWRGSQRDPESRNFKDFWMLAFAGMTQRRSRNSLTNLCDAQIIQRISENSTLARLHRTTHGKKLNSDNARFEKNQDRERCNASLNARLRTAPRAFFLYVAEPRVSSTGSAPC